jgi:GDSL-like Lipase/Acylhydrolase family
MANAPRVMRLRPLLRKIREYGLPLLLSLLLLEVGVRILDPSGISDLADQRRLWKTFVRFDETSVGKTMPSGASLELSGWKVETNRYGFRDADFPSEKADCERRILFLGDSYLFGHGVPQSALFPNAMEQSLEDRPGGLWQVINTGLGSYATHEQAAIATTWATQLDVDAIVLLYTFNDADPRFVRVSPRHEPATQIPESAYRRRGESDTGWKSTVRESPRLLRTALWLWPRTLDFVTWIRKSREQSLAPTSPVRFDDSNWAWRLSCASLLKIRDLARSLGIPFVVLYLNDYGPDGPAPLARANGEALQALCRTEDIPYRDLRSALLDRRLFEHRNSTVDGHPNEQGHRILAEEILTALRNSAEFARSVLVPLQETRESRE